MCLPVWALGPTPCLSDGSAGRQAGGSLGSLEPSYCKDIQASGRDHAPPIGDRRKEKRKQTTNQSRRVGNEDEGEGKRRRLAISFLAPRALVWTRCEGVSLGMCLGVFRGVLRSSLALPTLNCVAQLLCAPKALPWQLWIVPLRQRVFELHEFNECRARVSAGKDRKEQIAIVYNTDHELLHFALVDPVVEAFKFRVLSKTITRHPLRQALADDVIIDEFVELVGGHTSEGALLTEDHAKDRNRRLSYPGQSICAANYLHAL